MIISELQKVLDAVDLTNDSLLIRGEAGVGKSESIKQYAKDKNYHFTDLRLGNQEVGDLIGIPTIENGKTIWTEPEWLAEMKEAEKKGQKCLLFLDEMNRSQPDVKASALQIVLDKQIHRHHLPKNTLIVAAINPEDSEFNNYQVDSLDPALLDRFTIVDIENNSESWVAWARKNNLEECVIEYITSNPKKLHIIYEDGKIGPTPRSWAQVSKYVTNYIDKKIDFGTLNLVVEGRLGTAVAADFMVNVNRVSKLNVKKFLEEVEKQIPNSNLDDYNSGANRFVLDTFGKLEEIYVREKLTEIRDYCIKNNKLGLLAVIYDNIPVETATVVMKEFSNHNKDLWMKFAEEANRIHGSKKVIKKIIPKDLQGLMS